MEHDDEEDGIVNTPWWLCRRELHEIGGDILGTAHIPLRSATPWNFVSQDKALCHPSLYA